jgi:hypothetical protein
MKPVRAVVVLAVPLALTWMLLLAGMCLTPYWTCKVDMSVPFTEAWKPIFFVGGALSVVAAIVLAVDLLLIDLLPPKGYRLLALAGAGAVIATLPRILWDLRNGTLAEAFAPQLEFLPFALAGAVFIVVLAKLVTRGNIEVQPAQR